MQTVFALDPTWLATFVNEYAQQPRETAGESDLPYPDLTDLVNAPVLPSRRADLIEVADVLWPIFAGAVPQRARLLNDLLAEAALSPALSTEGEFMWMTRNRSARDLLLAAACLTLFEVVTSDGWQRLGICAARDCQDVFIDAAGRRVRRYCSLVCLNRSRVRDFRARTALTQRRPSARRR